MSDGISDSDALVLADAIDDLWSNIGAAEVRQLQPKTIELCQALHESRYHHD